MLRIVVAGIVLACVAFVAGGATDGQRRVGVEAASARTPTPIEVTNFPAVQAVNGTANVGTLPAVQAVVGPAKVSSLPLDADGNVRVSPAAVSDAPSHLFVKVADALPLGVAQFPGTDPYPVAGWKNAQFERGRWPAPASQNRCPCLDRPAADRR